MLQGTQVQIPLPSLHRKLYPLGQSKHCNADSIAGLLEPRENLHWQHHFSTTFLLRISETFFILCLCDPSFKAYFYFRPVKFHYWWFKCFVFSFHSPRLRLLLLIVQSNSPYREIFIFILGSELIHGRQRKSMDLKAIYSVFLTWKLARLLQL